MFIHGGWLHLAGNMLYLWIFAPAVEDSLGHIRFAVFYLFCGAVATAAHVLAGPDSTVPMVGASGAIAAVLGGYMAAFPGSRIHVLVFLVFFIQVIRIPALIVLGVWFAVQLINASADGGTAGGVAWYAHIAGFIAGYLIMARRRRRIRQVYGGIYA
jgi:membrane associated rhomboid family serine protease